MFPETVKKIERLAWKTEKRIRSKTHIPGWVEETSRFPQCDYADIIDMLEEAYNMGCETDQQRAQYYFKVGEKLTALIDAYTELASFSGGSERSTMETLLDIFQPEELVEIGYRERVKAYLEEYGAKGDWEAVCEKL